MSTDTMTPAVDTRVDCPADIHDTANAYRRHDCICPAARQAENDRKRACDATRPPRAIRGDNMTSVVLAGLPPFRNDPRRNCANLADPDTMFPDRAADVPDALAVCNGAPGSPTCPLRQECALWALDTRQIHGVYGGITATTRRKLIARRGMQVAA
jgi:hypothetical protein